jgi:hypothetical protein
MSERVPTCEHGVYGDCSQCLRAENDQLREALREMVRQHPCHHAEGSQRTFCACCIARRALGDTPDE